MTVMMALYDEMPGLWMLPRIFLSEKNRNGGFSTD